MRTCWVIASRSGAARGGRGPGASGRRRRGPGRGRRPVRWRRGYGGVGEAVEDVLRPHVDGVQQARVVGFREVAVAGLQFVRVEDHVGGADEGEGGEDSAGGERLFAPAVGQLGVDEGEFVLPHDLCERAAGQHQFTGGGEFAVLVGQGEGAEPGFVTGFEARVPDQGEHGVRQLVAVRGDFVPHGAALLVEGGGHGGPDLGSGEDRAGGRGQGAELLQQGVRGVRVGDLEAEAGEDLGLHLGGVGGGEEDLARPDRRPAVGERHGQSGEPVGVDAREAVVEPPPPLRVLLQAGQPVDGVGEGDAGDAQCP